MPTQHPTRPVCVVNPPSRSLCGNNSTAQQFECLCSQARPEPTCKPSVYLNFFSLSEDRSPPWQHESLQFDGLQSPPWVEADLAQVQHKCSHSGQLHRTLSAPDSRGVVPTRGSGAGRVWQLENNHGGSLTNQPGLPQIGLDWLPLSHAEDNSRNLSRTFRNGTGSGYEMGSQGPG